MSLGIFTLPRCTGRCDKKTASSIRNTVSEASFTRMKTSALLVFTALYSLFAAIPTNNLLSETHLTLVDSSLSQTVPEISDLAQILAQKLDSFSTRLKTFIYDFGFDVVAFENNLSQLKASLEEIDSLVWKQKIQTIFVESESPEHVGSKDQNEKLRFARFMFVKMSNATNSLRFYNNMADLGQHIVRCLVNLNVRLLALRDSEGRPNPQLKDYSKTLAIHRQYLSFWASLSANMADVPEAIGAKITEQYILARDTIDVLARGVPKSKNISTE